MIEPIPKPKAFDYLDTDLECFLFSDFNGPYAYIGLKIEKPYCACHAVINRWSHTVAKQAKKDWSLLIDQKVKGTGAKILVATYEGHDKRWEKFIRIFGFPKPKKTSISMIEV